MLSFKLTYIGKYTVYERSDGYVKGLLVTFRSILTLIFRYKAGFLK